ncbi:hypothetical protein [Streptomyces sp. NPDC059893]|uniref:hypothetical protein n=1 Tax=Streptomyces sp. NPDC059893 TaxID=3346990 RepID=UPI0036664CC6
MGKRSGRDFLDGIGGDHHGEVPDHGSGKTKNNHPPAALAALVGVTPASSAGLAAGDVGARVQNRCAISLFGVCRSDGQDFPGGGAMSVGGVDEDGPQPHGGDSAQLRHLRGEVEAIITEAKRGARRAHRRSKLWNATFLALGFPAAVLAGLSGATGLASPDSRIPAALLALSSAGVSAGAAFLRSSERELTNLRRRYAWQELEVQARLVLAREAYMSEEHLYSALSQLLQKRRAVPSSALVMSELQPSSPLDLP